MRTKQRDYHTCFLRKYWTFVIYDFESHQFIGAYWVEESNITCMDPLVSLLVEVEEIDEPESYFVSVLFLSFLYVLNFFFLSNIKW